MRLFRVSSWAVFHSALSFTGSVVSSLQGSDPFTFQLFQLGLVLCVPVFSGSVFSNLQGRFYILSSFF